MASPDWRTRQGVRPFDRDRTGMVLGEGAGSIIIEELSTAQARGATIYGEVLAAASSSVAERNLVAQRETAMTNVLRSVLKAANVKPDDVGHLHAHGLSTRTGDIEEARAINNVFGSRQSPVPVTAAKSYFGNLGAGSGMVELIASLLAMQHNRSVPHSQLRNARSRVPRCGRDQRLHWNRAKASSTSASLRKARPAPF